MSEQQQRGTWASRMGFILAAAGSAVGLGNIWRFPYVTGKNGGGIFVLVYLFFTILIGLPIMIGEVMLGRATQSSPVAAFKKLEHGGFSWIGWLGVAAGFLILSFYSVVAGWAIHYVFLAVTDSFSGVDPTRVAALFNQLYADPFKNVLYHGIFMTITVSIVFGGVQAGIERVSKVLMPALFLMLIGLVVYCLFLPGTPKALAFVFAPHLENFKFSSVLMALGQAFFSLSLGMGAMLTYGSYLPRDTGIPKSSVWVAFLDTCIALLSSMVVFPITFSFNMEPQAGPGLIFKSIPIAFSQMTGGYMLGLVFFVLVVFAAITSSISLQEVVTSNFIDLYGWSRRKVSLVTGGIIFVFGIPSALSGGKSFFGPTLQALTGKSFFDWADYLTANWMLPLGGMAIAIFVGFVLKGERRSEEFRRGTTWGGLHGFWLLLVRFVAPVAVLIILLQSVGALKALGIE
jgi:neurotransmitter:Na+ symporter, NSS family